MATRNVAWALGLVALLGLLPLGGFYLHGRLTDRETLVLATTTSTEDSGLLDVLLPPFEKANGCRVDVVAVGTGQALELGRNGDADILLVHAPEAELEFMAEGHGRIRLPVMYNDFVLVGPPGDPAGLSSSGSLAAAMASLVETGGAGPALFLSRGDDSGTHKKEMSLWTEFGLDPTGDWRQEVGSGMGETLRMAADRGAYTLADRGTYLALYGRGSEGEGRLAVVFEGDPSLYNPYHVIVVNPVKHPNVNADLAERLATYLRSDQARGILATFGVDKYGEPLFSVLDEG